jgi:sulfhydrogenase subunit beta (sulfur reductase)
VIKVAIVGELEKQRVPQWIEIMRSKFEVVAPVTIHGDTFFMPLSDDTQVALHYENTLAPLKEFFLPPTETMFTFAREEAGFDIVLPPAAEKKRVIFGVRPCDVSALLILDKVFDGDQRDEYYCSKRENTTLVSLSCIKPSARCFCGSVGSGPSLSDNFDVLLTELDDVYFVEVGSEKGRELVAMASELFQDTSEEREREKKLRVAEAESLVKKPFAPLEVARRMQERFDDAMWTELAARCMECGGCVYVCPTCWCFNVVDVLDDSEGRRIRCWDTCLFSGFTRMAGGLNSRASKDARIKQRFYHKWDYFVTRFGMIQCVGCGRCTETAPCGINWEQVFNRVIGE